MEIPLRASISPLRAAMDLLGRIPTKSGLKPRVEELLEAALSCCGAEMACVSLDPVVARGISFFARNRQGKDVRPDLVSHSTVNRVFTLRREVVSDDIFDAANGIRSISTERLSIRCIAAVPLWADDTVLGVLCIDHRSRAFAFDAAAIECLRALALLVAPYLHLSLLEEEIRGDSAQIETKERARRASGSSGHRAGKIPAMPEIVAKSAAMQRVLYESAQFAPSPYPVLITGETGSGKELIARRIAALHFPAHAPWAPVNCATLGDTAPSDLFGHIKGAFTGAERARLGWFRFCHGGALFLDEILRLSAELQGLLLRVVEDKLVTPMGTEQGEFVSVRLISATSADLNAEIAAGRLSKDILHRIGVHRIHIEPLRERREDILPFVRHFFAQHRPSARLAPDAEPYFERLEWPGNVRQVGNVLKNLILLKQDEYGRKEILHFYEGTGTPAKPVATSLGDQVADFERDKISAALRAHGYVVAATAVFLGLEESTLRKKMKSLGIEL